VPKVIVWPPPPRARFCAEDGEVARGRLKAMTVVVCFREVDRTTETNAWLFRTSRKWNRANVICIIWLLRGAWTRTRCTHSSNLARRFLCKRILSPSRCFDYSPLISYDEHFRDGSAIFRYSSHCCFRSAWAHHWVRYHGQNLPIPLQQDSVWPSCLFVRSIGLRLRKVRPSFEEQGLGPSHQRAGHEIPTATMCANAPVLCLD
jgi:hypothetical protein